MIHVDDEQSGTYYIWTENSGPKIDGHIQDCTLLPMEGLEAFVVEYGENRLSVASIRHLEDRRANRLKQKCGRKPEPFFDRWAQLREAAILFEALRLGIRAFRKNDSSFDIQTHVEVWNEEHAINLLDEGCALTGAAGEIAANLVNKEYFSGENISDRRVRNLISEHESGRFLSVSPGPPKFIPINS